MESPDLSGTIHSERYPVSMSRQVFSNGPQLKSRIRLVDQVNMRIKADLVNLFLFYSILSDNWVLFANKFGRI
jgi:hypothetical protein